MVGCHGTDAPVGKCKAQCVAVSATLYGRVHLYLCAESGVVFVGEEQMACHSLGRYALVVGREQFQLACGCDVRHVQLRPETLGQVNGGGGAAIADFHTSYAWMQRHVGVVAILCLGFRHVAIDDGGVFAVCHDG